MTAFHSSCTGNYGNVIKATDSVLKLAEMCILKGGGYCEQCSVTHLKIGVL